ncbi:MAG: ArsR family transcriptional regulator [Thermoplasmata archaeon]|nr:ArsR family transcriptional regulator [Candidatus Sysuiplasma acidicola]MBX8645184.1 ArsR family transcriptional regulator [Candidatus Sysuiplasma acidicola]MDH2904994.1 ArsR family transcriptional regulator [Methanomassiliicoccales archaeon]
MDSDLSMLGESKAKIIASLGEGEKTGQQLAGLLGINTTAVREHMDALERMGIISSRFVNLGVGRPRKVYHLTPLGVELLPKHYDTLLNVLMRKIHEKSGDVLLSQLISEVVKDFNKDSEGESTLPVEERISKVVNFLNMMGFMATVEKDGEKTFVVRHNCIFNKTAKLFSSVLCNECDTSFVKEPIGKAEVELVSCIGKGDTSCKNLIRT